MINSVAKCAACGADINLGDTSCGKCGKPLLALVPRKRSQMARLLDKYGGKTKDSLPPEQNAAQPAPTTTGIAAPQTDNLEPRVAFVSGLPAWSIEPPAVVVRRKAKV